MPANLAEIDGQVAMAYQGETPWHRAGTSVTDPTIGQSVERFLEAARLNWEVSLKSMFYRHGDKSIRVPSRRAAVRDVDGKLLATVGSDYHVMQNKEAFAVLQPAIDQFGVTIETAGALGRGDRVWMLAKMPQDTQVVPGDRLKNYLLILSGHNGWTAYTSRLTQVRAVCENTIQLALADHAMVKLVHNETAGERLDQVADLITNMMATAKKTGESFTRLAARKMTYDEMKTYVSEVLGLEDSTEVNPVAGRRREKILELATKTGKGIELAPGTAWSVFNAVTEYIDHVRPAEAKNIKTIAQANQSALFGTNAKLKAKALVLARKIAA